MASPTALTYLYTSTEEIADLASQEAVDLRLDDDADEEVSDGELSRIDKAINVGTAKCNLFLGGRYNPSQLVNSWQAHQWATIISVRWLCRRRLNPVPQSLQDDYDEALAEMLDVKNGVLSITDIMERETDQPVVTNQRLDSRYVVKQLRRERAISDSRPSVIPATVDFIAEIIAANEGFP